MARSCRRQSPLDAASAVHRDDLAGDVGRILRQEQGRARDVRGGAVSFERGLVDDLALQLFAPGIETETVPFDQIIPQVLEGKYEAGLIIHEGQLTYSKAGLHRVVDLGKWWQKVTGLPLPLGGNAIRRALGPELMHSVSTALRDSIQYALDHRDEALAYAMQFARDLDTQLADKFVGMYVNERTVDYGPEGREAVRRLLDMGHKAGIIPHPARVEFVD